MTPWVATATTDGPSTPTTCAPSVLAVIGRLLAPRRAPPHVRARTGSICVRVVLRRGGPCGAPEPLGAPCEPGTCPLCTPSGGGRITGCMATAHDHEDPAPSTGRARAGAHCTPAHASRCARGSRACVQPSGTYGTSARRGPGGCGWAVWPMAIARAREDPAPSPQHAHARHHIASHAGRHVVPRSWGPAGDAELYGYLVERAAASPPGSRTARRRQPCDRERAMRGGAAERTRDVPVRRGGTTARPVPVRRGST